MSIDLEELMADSKPVANTAPVINLARAMVKRENIIERLEADLAIAKAELQVIKTQLMPDLMRACDVKELTLGSGWKLELKPIFQASLPSQSKINKAKDDEVEALITRRENGFDWLKKNQGESIIEDEISVRLGKGQGKLAGKIVSFVKSLKLSCERERAVNHMRLNKFLREKIEIGVDVPLDTFAVFSGEQAEVVQIKEKGAKK